jgi:hypothetical protein
MKKALLFSLLSLFLIQCDVEDTLSDPRLIDVGFGVKNLQQALQKVQFATPKDGKIEELDVKSKDYSEIPAEDSFLVLSFSRLLNGDLIEAIKSEPKREVGRGDYKDKIPVVDGYQPVPGIIKIEKSTDNGVSWAEFGADNYVVSYRPEGGFLPKLDVPIYLNPGPAILIQLAQGKKWPVNEFIKVTLMDKFKNKGGTGVSGSLLFKTKQ